MAKFTGEDIQALAPHAEALPFPRLQTALAGFLEDGDAGAIDMVDLMLQQAALHRASDVHIEPWDESVTLRFRIDGLLHEAARLPRVPFFGVRNRRWLRRLWGRRG